MRFVARMMLVLLVAVAPARFASAQAKGSQFVRVADSSVTHIVKLKDGSTLIGRFVSVEGDVLLFETSAGRLTLRRADLAEVREVPSASIGEKATWPADPASSRLFFGPTARTLPRGEGDFSDTYLFFLSGSYGLGGHAQVGGGLSVFPFSNFGDNIFFATAKVGFSPTRHVDLAVGGLAGWIGTFSDDVGADDRTGLGTFYGVGTFGSANHSITVGTVFPYAGGDVADDPIFLLGGETRVLRSIKLVTENYVSSSGADAILSYGLRIFSGKLAVGIAFLNSTDDPLFPGIPYLDFVIRL